MSVNSIAKQKSMDFAKRIVRMYQYLTKEHCEYVMSKQVLRSGTSIGANIAEAVYGSSRKDFAAKLQIAQKEAAETLFWLELLNSCDYLSDEQYHSMYSECQEIMSILTATLKKVRE
jgi:four helix bundle protein